MLGMSHVNAIHMPSLLFVQLLIFSLSFARMFCVICNAALCFKTSGDTIQTMRRTLVW